MRILSRLFLVAAFGLAVANTTATSANTPPKIDQNAIAKAFKAANTNNWATAQKYAKQSNDPLAVKIVEWLRFQRTDPRLSFSAINAFIENNPSWPRLSRVRRSAEVAISKNDSPSELKAWFNSHPPLSGAGALAHLNALTDLGDETAIQTLAPQYWQDLNFSREDGKKFQRSFGKHLTKTHHITRLDRLIWDRQYWPARHMLPQVGGPQAALGRARLALMRREGGVDGAIAKVPADLREAPSLQYERLRWRRRKGKDEAARELLLAAPILETHQEQWAKERIILARRALTDGYYTEAQRLVADHDLTGGSTFADAEFLAGWISLAFLDEPKAAYEHFVRLFDGVQYPISRSRGAFWAGRAADASDDERNALKWWRTAAEFPATFYGQQAMAALGRTEVHIPFATPQDPATGQGVFEPELVQATKMLHRHKQKKSIRPFLRQLSELATTVETQSVVVNLANSVDQPHEAVRAAKRMAQLNNIIPTASYPFLPYQNTDGSSARQQREAPLVLSLIRQESAFNPRALSSAGARGMMQLMPSTAKRVARSIGQPYNRARLLDDPRYNVRLGMTHLDRLISRFDDTPALALAAYNAGPTRVKRWVLEFGDPRSGDIELVDWIESIPFAETRNYVQRVLESETVYRVLLSNEQIASKPKNPK